MSAQREPYVKPQMLVEGIDAAMFVGEGSYGECWILTGEQDFYNPLGGTCCVPC